MVGSVLDSYKVVSVLGEGGMGIVYKALDLKLERFIALKILNASSVNKSQFIERFKREARNQAKLTHPNIVSVYGFTDAEGILGIVMEYVEGETIEKMILRKQRLEVKEALGILQQILAGVGYAHQKGFIHRDIKPSNVIINREGVVKIMDFGISKSIFEKGITKTGTKIGTVLYMSPEQIRAEEPTQQSDIYSIGITFYEMLFGKTPFDLETEYEIMEAHLKRTPSRLSTNISSIPPEVDKMITKSLEKTIYKRYKRCEEMLEEVNGIMARYSNEEIPRKKESKIVEPAKSNHKLRALFFGSIALIVIALVSYGVITTINEFWPDLSKNISEGADSTVSYTSNPSWVSKSNWITMPKASHSNLSSIHFVDQTTGFTCGSEGTILKTIDGGQTWKIIPSPDSLNLNDVKFINSLNGFIIGESGKVLRTMDGGENWFKIDLNTTDTFFKIFFINSYTGFIVGSNGRIMKTNDGGNSWRQVKTNTQSLLFSLYFPTESIGYAVGWNGTLLKTTDIGNSWNPLPSFTENYLRDIYFHDNMNGFIAAGGGIIFETTDGGLNWKKFETKLVSGLSSINFIDELNGFAVSNKGEIIETIDGGKSWKTNNSGNFYSLSSITVTPAKEIFIAGINGTILKLK
ncbi:MAG: protein kinase [Ignavibacteria bacterium]|nr:protein kinase [Ignavibacteria bacterium]